MGAEEAASRVRRGIEYLHDLIFSPVYFPMMCISTV